MTKWVVRIYLFHIKFFLYEVLVNELQVGDYLHGRVHVTSVAHIVQPRGYKSFVRSHSIHWRLGALFVGSISFGRPNPRLVAELRVDQCAYRREPGIFFKSRVQLGSLNDLVFKEESASFNRLSREFGGMTHNVHHLGLTGETQFCEWKHLGFEDLRQILVVDISVLNSFLVGPLSFLINHRQVNDVWEDLQFVDGVADSSLIGLLESIFSLVVKLLGRHVEPIGELD